MISKVIITTIAEIIENEVKSLCMEQKEKQRDSKNEIRLMKWRGLEDPMSLVGFQ